MRELREGPSRSRLARYFLLKTGIFRSNRTEAPAKESLVLEGLVMGAALLLGAAIVVVVLHHR